ncbi:unnamed protein product [Cylindrotheca closterium]|uniref:Uncharacterized protein n=1 Tax=Cylindrotheca closterium TaxID=2856 RepID=A0AAD2G8B1_9STRA|nr:unnamed protein product [Cylindrotheca closterium]
MQEIQKGDGAGVDAPPFPSLRALDFDVADLWCHSVLEQPIDSNVEALFEELEKIIPRLTPLNASDEDNEDMTGASNPDAATAKARKTEHLVGIRMRMLEVLQDVLTLQFEQDEMEGSETQTSSPSAQLVFPNPGATVETISTIRDRLRWLFEKLKAMKRQSNGDGYHRLRRSLLAVEQVLDFEAKLTTMSNDKGPTPTSKGKGASATKSLTTKNKWLDQLSEMLKSLTKTFLEDDVPVPDALASVASFVLQLVINHDTESTPPSPSPLTQDDSVIGDGHDLSEGVSEEDIVKVQQGLQNLYGRPASPFYIAQLQEDARQLLLNWSTQDLEIPKLIQLGYLTGKQVTTKGSTTSFNTVVQAAGADVETQNESVEPANNGATNQEKEVVARRPQNDLDSEATLIDTLRKNSQGRTSEVVGQIWGKSKRRRNVDTNGILVATLHGDGEDDGGGKQGAMVRKQKGRDNSRAKAKDPPAAIAASSTTSTSNRRTTSPSKLKPPPVYPSQFNPEPSTSNRRTTSPSKPKPPPVYPSQVNPAPSPVTSQVSNAEDEDSLKQRAFSNKQIANSRASYPTQKTRTDVPKSTSSKRSRSQEPGFAKKQSRKKRKRRLVPTRADVLEAISQGIATYGFGNWTMIQKRSGGILKHMTGTDIKKAAEEVTALKV